MDRNFVVYKITNTINDKVYIGCSVNFEKRKKQHLWDTKSGKSKNNIHRAMRLHGSENFIFTIIFHALTHKDMLYVEVHLIEEYDSKGDGYNSTLGGEGVFGLVCTNETREKISVANTGRTHTEETKDKIGASRKGRTHTEESKLKISVATTGRTHSGRTASEETKEKMSDSQTKHPVSQLNTLTGELIATYASAHHAERATGVHNSGIGKCCNGKYKQAGGFIWRYI